MLNPDDITSLFLNLNNGERFYFQVKKMTKKSCFFKIEDFDQMILNWGYEFFIMKLDLIIEKLTFYEEGEISRKLIWLQRCLEKKYKETLEVILMEVDQDKLFKNTMSNDEMNALIERLRQQNKVYLTTKNLEIKTTEFKTNLNCKFETYDEKQFKELEKSTKDLENKLGDVLIPHQASLLFGVILRRALREYLFIVKTEKKESYRKYLIREKEMKLEEKQRKQREKELLKYFPDHMKGQEVFPFCENIFKEERVGIQNQRLQDEEYEDRER